MDHPDRRFGYRLALVMQRWDAEDFLDEISAEQFERWKAFYSIEPFGPLAEDQRAALPAWQFANFHRDKKKRPEPYPLSDFMLSKLKKQPRRVPLKVLREQMEAMLGKPDGQHQ